MLRATRASREAANALRSVIAVGMRREFQPPWPVPLPQPLPQNTGKHTLVLDIDETLIHTFGMSKHSPRENEPAILSDVTLVDYHVLVRPHLEEFLREVNELFEIVFWTAGTASYCSAILDAVEQQVLHLPVSFYNAAELAKEALKEEHGSGGSTNHANFYALSRTQTLERQGYMKFLPMLGRPMKGVVMLDDNERSFPLNPRHGIKIAAFDPNDRVLHRYMHAMQTKGDKPLDKLSEEELDDIKNGIAELGRLEKDRALLDILPVLRAVAKVPKGEDVTRELDHWRDSEYVKCDDFHETMNRRSFVRQRLLGMTLPKRNSDPIPPMKVMHMNANYLESATEEMKFMQRPHPRAKL